MLALAKVILCMAPWMFSLVATDGGASVGPTGPMIPPATESVPAPTVPAQDPVLEEPCRQTVCPIPGDTARRVIRFSYVPEILRTTDEL
jgi:hypothetical protein